MICTPIARFAMNLDIANEINHAVFGQDAFQAEQLEHNRDQNQHGGVGRQEKQYAHHVVGPLGCSSTVLCSLFWLISSTVLELADAVGRKKGRALFSEIHIVTAVCDVPRTAR
jgi:hypothetical protein